MGALAPADLIATIRECAWVALPGPTPAGAVWESLSQIGELLGSRVPGRAGAIEEVIVPRSAGQAHQRSLSAMRGFASLPLHVELSHRLRPCRYVLLGCLQAGNRSVPTTLLDRRTLEFTARELTILRGAPLLVRNGRRSFYSTILPPGEEFLRYDPGCMEAVDDRGTEAMRLMELSLKKCGTARHQWRAGDMLIIDNWRTLHGRASASSSTGRRLARILIDG